PKSAGTLPIVEIRQFSAVSAPPSPAQRLPNRERRRLPMIALKKILVPHDFSETSDAALRYAIELAGTFGARLHLLHVGEKVQTDIAMEFPLGLDEAMEDAVRERLLKIMTPSEQNTLKPEFAIVAGTPHMEIVNYAKEHGIDLIVMGT